MTLLLHLQFGPPAGSVPDPKNIHALSVDGDFVNHPLRLDDDLANVRVLQFRNHPARGRKTPRHPRAFENRQAECFRRETIIRGYVTHNRTQIRDRLVGLDYFPSHDGRSFSTSSCDFERPSRMAFRPFSSAASSARRSAASCREASSGSASIAAWAASFTLMRQQCPAPRVSQGGGGAGTSRAGSTSNAQRSTLNVQ